MSLSKVIELARGELGTTEDPAGSNMTKYGKVYGMNGVPWCVIFLWWIFNKAGERMAFFGGGETASCGTLLMWYQNMGQTVPVSEVQAGDIVLLNFHGKAEPEHCGLVVEPHWHQDASLDCAYTIEGNTSEGNGSQSNGGCVALKRRYPHQIVGVCRPQYQPKVVDDITGHWAEKDIRWCMDKGLMQGYPDGSFQPDKPVTRAELAAVLRRLEEK